MQLIVLGMHRSGTSAVCRILNMMGAYFGPEGSSIGFTLENPKGFWERKDIRALNDAALSAVQADWHKVADFDVAKLPDQVKEQFTKTAKDLIFEIDAHRPWVIKEPRLCLLFPLLRPLLEIPICVHVYRNPLQVAQSLKNRNGFPIHFGMALWEKYSLSALSASQGLPRLLVSYSQLIERPVETVQLLSEDLGSLGVQGLRCPSDEEIQAFIDPALFRERGDASLVKKEFLNSAQIRLVRAFEDRSVFDFEVVPALSAGALGVLKDHEIQEPEATKLNERLAEKKEEAKKEVEALQSEIKERDSALEAKEAEVESIERKLQESLTELEAKETEVEGLQVKLKERFQDVDMLIRWIDQLNLGISSILNSRRWKFGNTIGEFRRRALFKPRVPMAVDHIREVFAQIDRWKKILSRNKIREKEHFSSKNQTGPGTLVFEQKENVSPSEGALAGRINYYVKRSISPKDTSINIIIYSHKDLDSLRNTLISLKNNTDCSKHTIYLIDDSGMPYISDKVAQYSKGIKNLALIKNQKHVGYLRSIFTLLKKIKDRDTCLVIGNVVFTPHWLEGMLECNERIANAGFVSPLTNKSPYYEFKLNKGDNITSAAKKIAKLSLHEYPTIPVPDVHVFLMKRSLYDKVSSVLDFLIRAKTNNLNGLYELFLEAYRNSYVSVLADDAVVYVSNTKCHMSRELHAQLTKKLNRQTAKVLKKIEEQYQLTGVDVLRKYNSSDMVILNPRTVVMFFNSIIVRGGVLVLIQLANDLILKGVDVKCFILQRKSFEAYRFDLFFEPIFYVDEEDAAKVIPDHSVLMATFWTSAFVVDKVKKRKPFCQAYYFAQDFETLFYDASKPEESKLRDQAGESYYLDLQMLTSSDWIGEQIRSFIKKPDHRIRKIPLGISLETFYAERIDDFSRNIRVVGMARPETPRRGFSDLIEVLRRVHDIDPSIEFCFFGTNDLDGYDIPFPYTNYGVQSPEQLRGLYSSSDVYIDTSFFQGFGLTGLEAMACGCACVLTNSGGIDEYAKHESNALIEEAGDIEALVAAIIRLARDNKLRSQLSSEGLKIAQKFSSHETADALYEIVENHVAKRSGQNRKRAQEKTCNIIIPVHNELHFLKLCLESIGKYTDYPYRVYIVDDGSDKSTKAYLREFVGKHDNFYLIENEKNVGFVASCNSGMAAAGSGDLCLLNSDVIVTPGWLRKIVSCAYSDERIGIVSPLSTRSSHLWIKINPGDNIFSAASKIEELSEKRYPDIVTPEGWCFFIKREAKENLGQFDSIFGSGYCEESDYSMRALCNNYRTVCADDTFIFHKGRVSFKTEREERYKRNRAIFDKRWGHYYENVYKEFLSSDPLQYIRTRYEASLRTNYLTLDQARKRNYQEVTAILEDKNLESTIEKYKEVVPGQGMINDDLRSSGRIVFLLSTFEGYGGIISVTQLVNDLIVMGIDAKVVVLNPKNYDEDIFLLTVPIIFEDTVRLVEHFPKAEYVVATLWITVYYMAKIIEKQKHLRPYYFIQDYEPYFYSEKEKEIRQMIIDTYRLPGVRFAKTNWVIEKVLTHGVEVNKVPPGLDLGVFYPRDSCARNMFVILTMIRPSTEYRGLDTAVRVLTQIVRENKGIEIHTFGTSDQDLQGYAMPFKYVNHGRLAQSALPQVYSYADLYVDFSFFHGFGRTGLEAMACGTCCVLTNSGGVREYAIDGVNCLMSDSGDIRSLVTNIQRVIYDKGLRETLVKNGLETAKKYDKVYSSRKTWELIDN